MRFGHPAFAPYQALIDTLGLECGRPSPAPDKLDALNALAAARGTTQARGLPVRFSVPDGRLSARDYETHILQNGQVPTRPDTWHDVLNALVWLRFPRFKSALNAAHGEAIALETDARRGRRRDALTVLDESGVWVISRDAAWTGLLADRAWRSLFWQHRHEIGSAMHFVVVGHALLEKALTPYPAMTGKCLMLVSESLEPDAADMQAVAALAAIDSPRQLAPLPVQGIPGWDTANADAAYYDNADVFRPPRNPLS
ncbi:MAG: DUF3025 domain-containing protein [Thiobacillus sp.]|nr:DUF3025 domain-containing protein [Thiobacillus sp.]